MFELYLVYLDNNCVVEASEHVSASLQILCETEHSECIRQKFANPVVAGALWRCALKRGGGSENAEKWSAVNWAFMALDLQ